MFAANSVRSRVLITSFIKWCRNPKSVLNRGKSIGGQLLEIENVISHGSWDMFLTISQDGALVTMNVIYDMFC